MPQQPKTGTTDGAHGTAESIVLGQPVLPGDDSIAVTAHVDFQNGRMPGAARLARLSASPCASGVAASSQLSNFGSALMTTPAAGGAEITARFFRTNVDGAGLLRSQPTALDLQIDSTDPSVQPTCLRIPIVENPNRAEWVQHPEMSIGISMRGAFPTQAVNGYVGGVQAFARVGPWIDDLMRVRFEFGLGVGGPGRNPSPENDGIFLSVPLGIVADRVLWSPGRFGLGAELGYEIDWLYFIPKEPPDAPAELRARLHGPRAALRAMLLPPQSHLTALQDHPDPFSTSLDLFTALWISGDPSPVPVIGFQYAGDLGL